MEDKLKERRIRVAELKKQEEEGRLKELGYSTGWLSFKVYSIQIKFVLKVNRVLQS